MSPQVAYARMLCISLYKVHDKHRNVTGYDPHLMTMVWWLAHVYV